MQKEKTDIPADNYDSFFLQKSLPSEFLKYFLVNC